MGAQVHLLTGPARSGKTTQLVETYRAFLQQSAPGSGLWLAPTRRVAARVRGLLSSHSRTVCLAPQVMTFDQLAARILQAASTQVFPLNELMKRQIIGRLIQEAEKAGKLHFFSRIARTNGLLDLICDLIRELKRLEIWPEHLEEACRKRLGYRVKDEELVSIYLNYQEILLNHSLYDEEGMAWAARFQMRDGRLVPFENVKRIVVDGFVDFTRTQLEMLQVFSEIAEEIHIALPLETGQERLDVFGRPLDTAQKLYQAYPNVIRQELQRPEPGDWPTLTHLEQELFKNPRHQQPAEYVTNVEILAAAGDRQEIELIAGRIKRLLVEGDPQRPGYTIRPDDILVIFRSVAEVAPLISEVFREAGLPFALEHRTTLDRTPAMQRLLNFLQLQVEDWPFGKLLNVLHSNYFAPRGPQWQDPQAVSAVDRVIHHLKLPFGRKRLLQLVRRLAELETASTPEPETQLYTSANENVSAAEEHRALLHQLAQQALPLLEKLSKIYQRLPSRATLPEWSKVLQKFVKEIGWLEVIRQPMEESPSSEQRNDWIAWQRLLVSLAGLEELDHQLQVEGEPFSLAEFLGKLADILRSESLPISYEEQNLVRVLSAPRAQALRADYVFVAGLTEQSFPQPSREDRIYSEQEAKELHDSGLPFVPREQRNQSEMLLFYETITRANRYLCLSYPALNPKAEPISPSPYLTEVESAIGQTEQGESRIPTTRLVELSPTAPQQHAWQSHSTTLQQWRTAAVSEAMEKGRSSLLSSYIKSRRYRSRGANLVEMMKLLVERSKRNTFGAYEGMMVSPAAKQWFEREFHSGRIWSPSRLETYALCPYRFFLETILQLEPLEELQLEANFARRGQLFHDTLANLHQQLNHRHHRFTSPGEFSAEEIEALYHQVLKQLVQLERVDDPYSEALLQIEHRQLARLGSEYLQQHRIYDTYSQDFEQPLRPAHFELSFGLKITQGDRADPLSTTEPLVLRQEDQEVRLAGRIDRLDRGQAGGREVFNIIDYKTGGGSHYNKNKILSGEVMQLPLYALAAEHLLLAREQALPYQVGYWLIVKEGFSQRLNLHHYQADKLTPSEEWKLLKEQTVSEVFRIVRGIQSAEFPVYSRDDHCTGRCHFSTVCRINHIRSLEKTWPLSNPSPK